MIHQAPPAKTLADSLRRYRSPLMGIAIVLILVCHNSLWFDRGILNELNRYARSMAQVGVDLFLFCSGFGLYHAYRNATSLFGFYAKRLIRLLPAYFAAALIWCLMQRHFGEPVRPFLQQYALHAFFTRGELIVWYIPGILALYLAYPLLNRVVLSRKRLIGFSACVIGLSFFIAAADSPCLSNQLKTVNEVLLVRIPIFAAGAYCAAAAIPSPGKKAVFGSLLLTPVLLVCLMLSMDHITAISWWWVNRLLFAPLTVCLIILALPCLEKWHTTGVVRVLDFLGGITLELYLMQERLLIYLQGYVFPFAKSPDAVMCLNLLSVFLALTLGYVLHILCGKIQDILVKHFF